MVRTENMPSSVRSLRNKQIIEKHLAAKANEKRASSNTASARNTKPINKNVN